MTRPNTPRNLEPVVADNLPKKLSRAEMMANLARVLREERKRPQSAAPGALLVDSGWNDGYDSANGDYFRIIYPRHLPESERYDFNWQDLMNDKDAFQQFDYDALMSKK